MDLFSAQNLGLAGRVAWVTGASRGIGKSVALALASSGCHVAVGCRNKVEEAESVAASIRALDRQAMVFAGDLSDEKVAKSTHLAIEERLGPVDLLICCAGVVRDGLFCALEGGEFGTVMATNFLGSVYPAQLVARGMISRRFGRIVFLSSAAATKGGRGQSNYAASKGAIESLTRSLAVELGARGVTVNAIAPGVIQTDMTREVIALAKDEILQRQVIKRFGRSEEIAPWIALLCSDYGSFITGQVLSIDGGLKLP